MAKNAEEASLCEESHQLLLHVDKSQQGTCSSTSSEETGDYMREDDMGVSADLVGVQSGRVTIWKKPMSSSTTSSSGAEDFEHHVPPATNSQEHPTWSFSSCSSSDVVPMTIDTCEDIWTRLHDIRINGCVLEYAGKGKSIYDNGLAQSSTPLTPLNHYYEVTIVHPGENCYIAIGLARKDYPSHKHPGWNRGSIAYHADDGKIFSGSGIGTPFGPRCHLNDVLGCGIVFPCYLHNAYFNTSKEQEEEEWPWETNKGRIKNVPKPKSPCGQMGNILEASSESEDDIWWNNKNQVYEDKVQVFFMRNGKLLGMKEIRIPKGGFYPTIGMMSRNEKVMIDMSPLTG